MTMTTPMLVTFLHSHSLQLCLHVYSNVLISSTSPPLISTLSLFHHVTQLTQLPVLHFELLIHCQSFLSSDIPMYATILL